MRLTGHYQNAYITHDLDKGMELFKSRFELGEFLVFDPAELTVQTPRGESPYSARIATAWAGTLQIELIQPLSGFVDFYREVLPDDPADVLPRFHHIALRRPAVRELHRDMAESGMPMVMEGAVPGLTFTYLDARPVFGHYIELCTATEEMWQYNSWPTNKPLA